MKAGAAEMGTQVECCTTLRHSVLSETAVASAMLMVLRGIPPSMSNAKSTCHLIDGRLT